VSELNLLTGDEQRAFFLDWQGNDSPVDERTHALARMNEAAAVSPHHPAVVGGGATLTRETLARSAGAIAHALRRLGLDAGARVGLVMDRTPTAIAAMLGILEAGYAYVPLDPEYPEERTRFVIGHAGIRVAVTTGELRSKVASLVSEVIVCEHRLPATTPVDTLPSIQPQQIAYVIYTSGSTGRPKGVPVSHHNLHVSTEARFQYYRDTPERFLLVPSLSFDSSVAGIFWTLAAGGTLVMASQEDVSDPRRLASLIREHRVTDLLCIPALYRELLRHSGPDLGSLRRVIVAGEPCPPRLVGLHLHAMPGVALFNEYGPTEATVWATVHLCTAADASAARVPIGRPIPRAGAFVLDACQQPLPVGVPGELYLAGGGLAAGYLEDPQQTQQRFLTRALPVIGATRLYRTGDRARWRRDGVLELMGRTDDQIKLRGYRIEPGEIAAALEEHPDVDRAIVMAASHRSPDSGHDDLSQMLSGLPPADIEAFVVDAESYPAEDSSRVRDDGQERVPDEPTRVVSRDRFRLALRSDAGFVSTPREAQRNWLLGRALEEFAGDLEHLDRLAATLVSGYDHHLDRDLHDVSRQALTDQQIMEDWQTPLMRAMAGHVTSSHGHVLEIGFGRGVSAEMIQHFGVASHTIVEPNDHSVRRYFEPWRRRHADRNISLLRARWQDVDERLGLFDGVFFHAFPMNEREFSEYVLRSVTFAEHAFGPMAAHLRDGGVFTYLTTEIDSLGRGHQRSLLRHFRSFSVHVEPLAVPEDTRDSWWAQTMVVVKAVK
jgi:amino acid adenylation domain-containing protein